MTMLMLLGGYVCVGRVFVLEEEEDMMRKITRKAMSKTNKFLKLNRELDCDIQFGYRYSEIH